MSSMPESSLSGRQIVLAGGAGGIGAAVTSLLLDEGARVTIGYRANRERAERWADSATVVQADLASASGRALLLDTAPSIYGLVVLAGDPATVVQADLASAS